MPHVHSITIQPIKHDYDDHFGTFIRHPMQEANLILGFGIEGDAKGGHHPNRQINLLSQEWVEEKAAQGYTASPGSFGEQLALKGIDLADLGPNTHLRLGEEAVIEITSSRTGCERLDAAQPKPMDEKFVGFMARVVESGKVRVGDPVKVLERVLSE